MNLLERLKQIPRELKLFLLASLVMGIAYSTIDSTLNNYLELRFTLSGFQRSFLELPRELPGFSVVFVTALLWFLSSRRLGVVSMLLGLAGALLIGFCAPTYGWMVLCLFVYSLGQHLFLPVSNTIGMELAQEGKTGRRLGQLNAVRNVAAIIGSLLVFAAFKYLGLSFQHTFILAAVAFGIAAVLLFFMRPEEAQPAGLFLKLHKEYTLYYILSILYGSRKQLFITFAPWVLVTVFKQPTQTIATLMIIGGVIGIGFQPLLGWSIDRLGERTVLTAEAALLVVVCMGYAFGGRIFSEQTAFYIACCCYLLDAMLMSVNMARATYIKKIARTPEDVQPALTASVTIDHMFSIAIALLGGLVWNTFGYQYVFVMGMVIAAGNFIAALKIRLPQKVASATTP